MQVRRANFTCFITMGRYMHRADVQPFAVVSAQAFQGSRFNVRAVSPRRMMRLFASGHGEGPGRHCRRCSPLHCRLALPPAVLILNYLHTLLPSVLQGCTFQQLPKPAAAPRRPPMQQTWSTGWSAQAAASAG